MSSVLHSHLRQTHRPESGDPNDPRLGTLIAVEDVLAEDTLLALVGFPIDEGVKRNGGRPGAAAGPAAIRESLYRMTPDARNATAFSEVVRRTVDLGDIRPGRSLSESQRLLGEVVAELLRSGVTPVVLGGGHETAFGHFLGYAVGERKMAILNIDAHADVRPLIDERGHSGSPFRQALEHESGACTHYSVAGLQPGRNARQHIEYVLDRGGHVRWASDLMNMTGIDRLFVDGVSDDASVMLSVDLDAVDAAFAPGVSAPSGDGLKPNILLALMHHAGTLPNVTSVDVVELNPTFDLDGRTARLAAQLVWSYLSGFASRFE